jgi:hypothetical protein
VFGQECSGDGDNGGGGEAGEFFFEHEGYSGHAAARPEPVEGRDARLYLAEAVRSWFDRLTTNGMDIGVNQFKTP